MALKLVVNSVESYKDTNDLSKETCKNNVTLTTSDTTSSLILYNVAKHKQTYILSLLNLTFQKKMYQPTEIVITLQVSPNETSDSKDAWCAIPKEKVTDLFQNKKVGLYDVAASYKIGDDFYVKDVLPSFKSNSMLVVLKVYSLDKLLTLEHDCRSFVSKKLVAGILASEMTKYKKPYATDTSVAFSKGQMKVLSYLKKLSVQKPKEKWADSSQAEYDVKDVGTEHIFPYLVQYNESFYDLLARTTNRWGEFMYYEDGKLNIGYPDEPTVDITHTDSMKDKFKSINYINLDDLKLASNYDLEANYDKNILDTPLEKSPNKLSGLLYAPGGKMDKVIMKKFAAFFKNDKNIPTFIGNQLFDDLYGLATKAIAVDNSNNQFDEQHFSDENRKNWPEKYGQYKFKSGKKEGFNIFSELNSDYDSKKYGEILNNERSAAVDAVCIDFDTTFPCLKLGQVIQVYGKEYIVVQIDCKPRYQYKVNKNNWVEANTDNPELVYSIIGTVRDTVNKKVLKKVKNESGVMEDKEVEEKLFYPTVIASGHVRYADPQMATVIDASDPAGKGRVRVMFSWQSIPQTDGEIDFDKAVELSSPWLQFTANAGGGSGITGMHYPEDKVFVGFLDGNVERPYVLGALSGGAGSDIACETPGGHKMTIGDDDGGISNFVLGTLAPGLGTLSAFLPGVGDKLAFGKNWEKNLSFGGGFEITDQYGIYKVSGSTDGREVGIASPWGNVNISAFTGISISAPNGDISIRGKNVSIEAGNNLSLVSGKNVSYKLWKEKDSKKGSLAQFFIDIPLQVTKKLAETLTNIVDLSIVRSVVEVVMKPVEGALTVKSNRFLKLEAGKSKCAYPVSAYKKSKEELQKELDEERKKDILAGTGKILGVGNAMKEIFSSIESVVANLDTRYQTHYNNCVDLKAKLKDSLAALEPWRNNLDKDDKSALKKKFDDLWKDDLIGKLWVIQDEYKDLKEDDLQFSDEIKVDGNPKDIVDDTCHNAHTHGANFRHPIVSIKNIKKGSVENIDIAIVEERKRLRAKALNALNDLGREIHYLLHFDAKRIYTKDLSSFYLTPAPEDYKDKMTTALSKAKCPNVYYYKMPSADLQKLESKGDTGNWLIGDVERLYVKRLVAMNLIEEFGFYHEELAGDDAKYKVQPAVIDASEDHSLVNNTCWEKYVNSISGVPPLGKAESSISSIAKGALSDALGNLTFWDSTVEKFTWGQGKAGKILFVDDSKTYYLTKKGGDEADVAEASKEYLKAADCAGKEQTEITNFLTVIKNALKEVKNS